MRKCYRLISKRDIRPCKYCGGQIAWMQYSSGGWYPADVQYERERGYFVVSGVGNHYNLKAKHDCRGHARLLAESLRGQVAEYSEKLTKARDGLKAAETCDVQWATMDAPAREICDRIMADWRAIVAVMPAEIAKLEAEIAKHDQLANA